MIPTNRLRFVDRNEPVVLNGEKFDNWRKVLQQWWSVGLTVAALDPSKAGDGEWRDVPLEKES